jgi:hypothetical protein
MKITGDPDEYRARLAAKLDPAHVRMTLGFAGLFQITHELIKQSVLKQVHDFYLTGFDETGLPMMTPPIRSGYSSVILRTAFRPHWDG